MKKIKLNITAILLIIIGILLIIPQISSETTCQLGTCKISGNDCRDISIKTGKSFSFLSSTINPSFKAICSSNKKCSENYESDYFCSNGKVVYNKYTFSYDEQKQICTGYVELVETKNCKSNNILKEYKCKCLINDISSCELTKMSGDCILGECVYDEKKETFEKRCAEGCDTNFLSKNYGHCNADCNPKCNSCQECYTWNTQSSCFPSFDGKKCNLPNSIGVCKNGNCTQSSCNPVEKFCEKCDVSNPSNPIRVADLSKNGQTCAGAIDKSGLEIPSETGVCINGICKKKTCNILGKTTMCGNYPGVYGKIQVCCNPNTETCIGEGTPTPLCCNKETEVGTSRLNVNGYLLANNLISAEVKILRDKNGQNYQLTLADKLAIIEKLRSNSELLQSAENFYYFCEPIKEKCEADGKHKICYGRMGSSCCPIDSTCGTFTLGGAASSFVHIASMIKPINIVNIIPDWLKNLLDMDIKPDFTVGTCGSSVCAEDSFPCVKNNLRQRGNVICCKKDKEVCSFDIPYNVFLGTNDYVPHCEPINYCSKGYTECFIPGMKKLCCKNGEEFCFIQNQNYAQCLKI